MPEERIETFNLVKITKEGEAPIYQISGNMSIFAAAVATIDVLTSASREEGKKQMFDYIGELQKGGNKKSSK